MNRKVQSAVFFGVLAVFGAGLVFSGCGRNRTRVPAPEQEAPKDYRKMIERTRNRKEQKAKLEKLQEGISRFQIDHGRIPSNLWELVRYNYIPEIPEPPQGYTYYLNPQRGSVVFVETGQPTEGIR